ncbi:MAG: hypothetical protein ACYDHH_09700 [Solirubrobacteraceae bacterium]
MKRSSAGMKRSGTGMKRSGAAALAVLCLLVLPSSAAANAYTRVFRTYQRQNGVIRSCQFHASTLRAALSEEPIYEVEYFADFGNAVQAALNAEVAGSCSSGALSGLPPAGPNRPGAGAGHLPRSSTQPTSSGIPFAIGLLGALAALIALGGGVYALAWRSGTQSLWLTDWRHAAAEAGYRFSGRSASLTDRRRWRRSDRRRSRGRARRT